METEPPALDALVNLRDSKSPRVRFSSIYESHRIPGETDDDCKFARPNRPHDLHVGLATLELRPRRGLPRIVVSREYPQRATEGSVDGHLVVLRYSFTLPLDPELLAPANQAVELVKVRIVRLAFEDFGHWLSPCT